MPFVPNDAAGTPVFASSATIWYPGVTYTMRESRPSVQYARPRPDSWRGADSPRLPSFSLCIQISSPVPASSATTARRVPAVE